MYIKEQNIEVTTDKRICDNACNFLKNTRQEWKKLKTIEYKIQKKIYTHTYNNM